VTHLVAVVLTAITLVLDWSIGIYGRTPVAISFTIFPLLLLWTFFVTPLNKPRVVQLRPIANAVGGILPIASLFLPYSYLGDTPWYPFGPGGISQGVPQLIIVGSILTFLSNFGSLVVLGGLAEWSTQIFFGPACFNPCFSPVLAVGYWLAWCGSMLSLLGKSWTVLPITREGQKLLGLIMFPTGLISIILGFVLATSYAVEFGPIYSLVFVLNPLGFLLMGAGLSLFFGLNSTTLARFRKALQKPVR